MAVRETYHDLVRHDVLGLLPDSLGALLDFGGGIGATSAYLRETNRAERAVLFDQIAAEALPGIDGVEAIDLDDHEAIAAALARSGNFDTILALDILEHLKDPWGVVQLLEGSLRPGGVLIVSVPNVSFIGIVWSLVMRGRFQYTEAGVMDRTHLRWFTRTSAIELAKGDTLCIEAVEVNTKGRKGRYLLAATLGFAERFLAQQYKIRVRKPA